MPKVKTIELTGTETAVTFPQNYPHYMILNMGDSEVCASGNPGIVPYADGVYAVPAGTEIRVSPETSGDTVWLLGSGRVQIRAEEIAAQTSFRSREKGGDNGFSGDYNDLTNKPDIPVPSKVIDSNSTNETVSTSKAVFDYVASTVDLSNYATVDDLSTKQDMLVSSSEITDSNVDWNNFEQKGQNGIFVKFIGITGGLDDNATHGLGGVYGYGVLMQIWLHSATYQIYLNDYREIYTRTKYQSAWRSWTRLDFNGRPISDPTLDWNTLTSNGIYTIGYNGLIQEESHGPAGVSGWGVLTVTNTGLGQNQTACILQKYESPASGIYYRSLWNSSGDWSPWYKISSTAMTN